MIAKRYEGITEISAELEILLSGMGLPFAGSADRAQAVGLLVSPAGTAAATVEWFVSTAVRNAAASEQVEGRAEGRAALLHRAARAYLHHAIAGVLEDMGYSVAETSAGLRVEAIPGKSGGAETAAGLSEVSPEGFVASKETDYCAGVLEQSRGSSAAMPGVRYQSGG